jgi:mannose-1-phosphate guanylyltransferase/mannose-6-phosphate isomerase
MRYLEEIKKAKQNDLVLVLPSDHQIVPEFPFVECVTEALELANQHYLVIFGICPNRPETGYGYIQASHAFSPYSMNVRTFVEKPDRKTAEQYLAQGGYYWNSGMVLTSIQTFWEEMRNHAPDIYSLAQCSWEEVVENYALFPNRSLDYALLEHSKRLLVCPLELSWFDLGSWDHVYEALEKDEQGNVLQGSVHTIDTHNCLILGKRSLIATIGLEDLCIVETDGAILISKKGTSQQVKSLVNILATTPQGVHHEHNLS